MSSGFLAWHARRTASVAALTLATTGTLWAFSAPTQAAPPSCGGEKPTIVGTAGPDTLRGTAGRDVIHGLAGDDRIVGLGGNDVLCGGPGSDVIMGNRGKDRIFGQGDKKWRDQFQSILTGDRLSGGPGNDRIDPGPRMRGADLNERDLIVFDGGPGVRVDLSDAPEDGFFLARGQGRDRIGWHDDLAIVGSQHDDRIIGSELSDYVVGLGGDDRISGRGGRDYLTGDRDNLYSHADGFTSEPGDDVVRGGDGADELTSTKGSDRLVGGTGDDVLTSRGKGADQVIGGRGGDLLFVTLSGSLGMADGLAIEAGAPDASAIATDIVYLDVDPRRARLSIDLQTGELVAARGAAGTPRSAAVSGVEEWSLTMRRGRLDFVGSDGPDQLLTEGSGLLRGEMGAGDDWVQGTFRMIVDLGLGDDDADGGKRDDRLLGGDGDDRLSGSGGDDYLEGGTGTDVLRGGPGTDTCVTGESLRSCEA